MMNVKVSKKDRTSSMLDKAPSKTLQKDKDGDL